MHLNARLKFAIFILILLIGESGCKNPERNLVESDLIYKDPNVLEISQAIEKDPRNAELLFQRAELFCRNNEYSEAIEDLNSALGLDPTQAKFYHLLADAQLDNLESRQALSTLERCLKIHPGRIQTLLKLSEFQLILKQNDESIITVNEILGIDPNHPEAYFMLGMNFRALKDTSRAINSFQRAVELEPELTDAWIILGNFYESVHDPAAIQYYDNAISSDPGNVAAIHSKAFYLQNHDQIHEAIDLYKQIHQISPDYTDAYLNVGILYLELDSLESAKEHFNILTGIDPANARAYFYRGFCHEQLGNYREAQSDYQSALNLLPNYEQAKIALERLVSSG